jgi:hypothetical protein
MIISEKQIMQLIHFAHEYRRELLVYKSRDILSEVGQKSLDDVSEIIQHIANQQSEELKEISNEPTR